MPITPFHEGPAPIVKAALREKFSITVFSFSQTLIDLQPLFVILVADFEFHGISHTYLGATVLAIISSLIGKPGCEFFLRWWNRNLSAKNIPIMHVKETISCAVVISSAFIGTYSHILLDSIMHADLQPFYPAQIENNLLGLVEIEMLHILCAIAGIIGLILYYSFSFYLMIRKSRLTDSK